MAILALDSDEMALRVRMVLVGKKKNEGLLQMGEIEMRANWTASLIPLMHMTMLYSGFALWWYYDGHEFKLEALR